MTLEQVRDLALIVYAVFWTIAGVVLTVLAYRFYKRASGYLDAAREAGEIISTVAGIGAVIREIIRSIRGNGKDREEEG